MIRPALPTDQPAIQACAELAYTRYIPLIGRKPAPMLADYASQIAAGWVHVALDEQASLQGFIVFYPTTTTCCWKTWPCCPVPPDVVSARR